MTNSSSTCTTTNTYPIFKGALYGTTKANNTAFFASDLVPTNAPTTFRLYYAGNSNGGATRKIPYVQRTNGATVVQENIGGQIQLSDDTPETFDFIVGPSDTINFIFPSGVGSASITTMIVLEIETGAGYSPIRVSDSLSGR